MSSPLVLTISANPYGMLVAFGAGILSFMSPCCLPLVPGYLGMISGLETSRWTATAPSSVQATRRVVFTTLLFVAGFSVVFVMLGAIASSWGQLLLHHRRVLDVFAGTIIVIVGVLLATGVTPSVLSVERRLHVSPSKLRAFAPPVMGMAFAFGWTPCIGPVLGAVLSIAAAKTTVIGGMALLGVYSVGLGVPFILAGTVWGRTSGLFAWFKDNYRILTIVSGSILSAWGVLLVLGDTSVVASWMSHVMVDLHLGRLTVS